MKKYFSLILFLPYATFAQVQVAKIFSNNMILQRNQPVHIWGIGIPGKVVNVSFGKENKTTIVQPDSSWNIFFHKYKATLHPKSLIISCGEKKIAFKNILMGDIWLCIGQSNMEFPMKNEIHFADEIKRSNQPLIRFYNPSFIGKNIFGTAYTDSMNQQLASGNFYSNTSWELCDSNSIKEMSAVGYYFGKEILQHENVPIGLIHLAIGGCPIETFISKDVLKHSKRFFNKVNGNWLTNEALPVWIRERGKQNVGGVEYADTSGPNHGYKPGFAFENGIKPIIKLPVKGIIWYQGESNAQEIERVNEYAELQKLMIEDYRAEWHQPQLPFYWVQISSIDTAQYKSQLWPQFRDKQRKLLIMVKYGGMAVCSDIGFKNSVHPTNKKAVGDRLARWALNKTYGENIIPSGPLPVDAKYKNGKAIISFQYAGDGLRTSDGKTLRGFSIDGETDANAIIKENEVYIMSKQKPRYVYYAWKPFTDANLVNSENLPASTFKIKVN